ncbi:MAG: quinolinate synthase NadA [Promethearchaeota archaeon]
MTVKQLQEEVLKLKKENDVTILAHYYQPIEIQEVADFLGDSLGLSKIAKERANTDNILFAGVVFMAETASILNQDKRILIPHPEALCPMAAFLNPEMVKKYRQENPELPVITYVNSTAAVKAESDICCTSSNAISITKKMKEEYNTNGVLFGPDANLADFVEQKTGIKTIKMPENGHCIVHSRINAEDIKKGKTRYPQAKLLVHPECKREVRDLSDFVGSTAGMYNFVENSSAEIKEFLIGTEKGLIERLAADFPNKTYHIVSEKMICYNMKKNTIELTKYVLENLDDPFYEIRVPSDIAKKAIIPINRMLE